MHVQWAGKKNSGKMFSELTFINQQTVKRFYHLDLGIN